jgi:hypothetical protein
MYSFQKYVFSIHIIICNYSETERSKFYWEVNEDTNYTDPILDGFHDDERDVFSG